MADLELSEVEKGVIRSLRYGSMEDCRAGVPVAVLEGLVKKGLVWRNGDETGITEAGKQRPEYKEKFGRF